jgi:quinoprotein dehydrogenase-associated probable ABC transporter substrate-binding protein
MKARGFISLAAALLVASAVPAAAATDRSPPLRVCADPNNMPFSNERGEGLENKLAELVAGALGMHVEYTWHAQRRGFIRQTLGAGLCDVIMGIPHLDMLATTRAYYSSKYVFVSRADRNFTFDSLDAPELAQLTIGVHLIGDDGYNTPPAHALAMRGLVENVRGYMIYGDYRREAPPMRLLDAVVSGEIDVAAVWGPQAGWYVAHSEVPLRMVPITGTEHFLPLVFQFPIAIGVRKEDIALRNRLNEIIAARRPEIRRLLASFAVPVL